MTVASASPNSAVRVWHNVVGSFRAVEATRYGGLLLGHVWPALIFAMPLAVRAWELLHMPRGGSLRAQAAFVEEVVTVVFLALVVVLFVVRQRSLRGEHTTFVPGLVALAGTFFLSFVAYLPVPVTTSAEALLASSGVIIAGTLWAIWSLATLGRCFGLFAEARGLVTRGPYGVVRHPVYLGELISAVGLLLARPSPLTVGIFVAFVALQYARMRFEEQALARAYPAEYAAYARNVSRIVPGVH